MAEQFLDGAQIAAARQQVGGEGMAQARAASRCRAGPARRASPAIASWMTRGDSGPPLAPTNKGPEGFSA